MANFRYLMDIILGTLNDTGPITHQHRHRCMLRHLLSKSKPMPTRGLYLLDHPGTFLCKFEVHIHSYDEFQTYDGTILSGPGPMIHMI